LGLQYARLNRLLKKCGLLVMCRRLKPARKENKRLIGTTEEAAEKVEEKAGSGSAALQHRVRR